MELLQNFCVERQRWFTYFVMELLCICKDVLQAKLKNNNMFSFLYFCHIVKKSKSANIAKCIMEHHIAADL